MFVSERPVSQIRTIEDIKPVLERAKKTESNQRMLFITLGILGLAVTGGCIAGSVLLAPHAIKVGNPTGFGFAFAGTTALAPFALAGSVAMFIWSKFLDHKKDRLSELTNDQTLDPTIKTLILLRLQHEGAIADVDYNYISKILTGEIKLTTQQLKELNLDTYLQRLKASDHTWVKNEIYKKAYDSQLLKDYNPDLRTKILTELQSETTELNCPFQLSELPRYTKLVSVKINLQGINDMSTVRIPQSVTTLDVQNPPASLRKLLDAHPKISHVRIEMPEDATKEGAKALIQSLQTCQGKGIEIKFSSNATELFRQLSLEHNDMSLCSFIPSPKGGGVVEIQPSRI